MTPEYHERDVAYVSVNPRHPTAYRHQRSTQRLDNLVTPRGQPPSALHDIDATYRQLDDFGVLSF
jgi:hypothetical protein